MDRATLIRSYTTIELLQRVENKCFVLFTLEQISAELARREALNWFLATSPRYYPNR